MTVVGDEVANTGSTAKPPRSRLRTSGYFGLAAGVGALVLSGVGIGSLPLAVPGVLVGLVVALVVLWLRRAQNEVRPVSIVLMFTLFLFSFLLAGFSTYAIFSAVQTVESYREDLYVLVVKSDGVDSPVWDARVRSRVAYYKTKIQKGHFLMPDVESSGLSSAVLASKLETPGFADVEIQGYNVSGLANWLVEHLTPPQTEVTLSINASSPTPSVVVQRRSPLKDPETAVFQSAPIPLDSKGGEQQKTAVVAELVDDALFWAFPSPDTRKQTESDKPRERGPEVRAHEERVLHSAQRMLTRYTVSHDPALLAATLDLLDRENASISNAYERKNDLMRVYAVALAEAIRESDALVAAENIDAPGDLTERELELFKVRRMIRFYSSPHVRDALKKTEEPLSQIRGELPETKPTKELLDWQVEAVYGHALLLSMSRSEDERDFAGGDAEVRKAEDAIDTIISGLRKNPTDPTKLEARLGELNTRLHELRVGTWETLKTDLEKLEKRDKDGFKLERQGEVDRVVGYALFRGAQLKLGTGNACDKARERLVAATKRRPVNPLALNDLAVLVSSRACGNRSRGDLRAAERYLTQSIDMRPYDYYSHEQRGRVRLLLAEREAGRLQTELVKGAIADLETASERRTGGSLSDFLCLRARGYQTGIRPSKCSASWLTAWAQPMGGRVQRFSAARTAR